MKNYIPLKAMLAIPKKLLVSSKSKLRKKLTTREMEESMHSIHGTNSMKDLRPDGYKGITFSISKLYNIIKKRKG